MNPWTVKHAAGVLALLGFVATSCDSRHPAEGTQDNAGPVVPVRAGVVTERMFQERVEAPGQWRSSGELVVTAPFAAYVESLQAEVGDVVTRGSVVAMLVTQESRAALLGAEQLVASAADATTLAESQRALRQARRDLVRVPLIASGEGTVVRRSAAPGGQLAAGGELMALIAPSTLVFEAHVSLRDVGRVAPGQSARIAMEDGRSLDAQVRRRMPQTSAGDQSALVWLAPLASPTVSLLDRFGTARIAIGDTRQAPAVPDSALVEDDLTGQFRVARVGTGDVATWVTVKLGVGDRGWHVLLDPPMAPGTRLIVSGQRGMPDSTRVSVER